ncbi:energy transducer TonB [Hyphobacterium sp. CCMP332]|uniref:energy transducer TonB n=1 Tax=Hyphobacterium sp. CCMP332 TaxID=2749086 RepID=UPI0016505D62|nr:energy transducer TonB [Hyphobacterium sp. CCMP332]QNL19171.1 energy transducer TonB [Hyphobacterium sp. CCMP332]
MQRILRTSISLPFAGLVTVSLAFFMSYLISVEGELRPETPDLQFDLFPTVEVIDATPRPDLAPVLPVDPPPPPPAVDIQTSQLPTEDFIVIAGTMPSLEVDGIDPGSTNFNISDRDVQPLVRIPPAYPVREADRGVEGDCLLQFDVTTQGSPVNIQVLECDSSGFARESVRAVERWRYNPRVRNGVPEMYRGVQTRLEFNLGD